MTNPNESFETKPEGDADLTTKAFQLSSAMDPVEPASYRRRRRIRPNYWLILTATALVLAWYVYVFPMERWESRLREWWNPKGSKWLVRYESPQREMVRTIQFLATLWFFYFGASIGSFFNVVAWRWPNGKGIVFGGSKCPFCDNRLKFIHNTPVIGWLWCKGRCAFCHLPIATRYLWMEIFTGLIFAILLLRELVSGGANLPHWTIYSYTGFEHIVFTPKWPLITAYFEHSFMFAALIMLAAASMERLAFPWAGWFVFVTCICVPRALMPELEFVPWTAWISSSGRGSLPVISSVTTIFLGATFASMLAALTKHVLPKTVSEIGARHWKQAALLIGAVLGWQASLFIIPAAIAMAWILIPPIDMRRGNTNLALMAALTITALIHHLGWREIAGLILQR